MLNRCEFIGFLGGDPTVNQTQSGTRVANFSLAVSEKWKDKNGERQERTTWVPVVAWAGLADIAGRYLKKGSKVYVAGKFSVRKWSDQQGNDRYSTEVVLQGFDGTLVMLDGAGGGSGNNRTGDYSHDQSRPETPQDFNQDFEDEIPF
ncbi:single-stranded DNA-binding protein [Henriciella sp.]|uniref:single-stranded DNA-binding protein n=1 Tax=Henriciella sp. TaxID=1968823 RepID=UPI000C10E4BD|nr:single-stranded DNA-binding protein [Henriciella sp.]PHR83137.1 MAG: single-stranded DNA-binding protein [Henriciella sp.]